VRVKGQPKSRSIDTHADATSIVALITIKFEYFSSNKMCSLSNDPSRSGCIARRLSSFPSSVGLVRGLGESGRPDGGDRRDDGEEQATVIVPERAMEAAGWGLGGGDDSHGRVFCYLNLSFKKF
jgi:hypothetical protein